MFHVVSYTLKNAKKKWVWLFQPMFGSNIENQTGFKNLIIQ